MSLIWRLLNQAFWLDVSLEAALRSIHTIPFILSFYALLEVLYSGINAYIYSFILSFYPLLEVLYPGINANNRLV